MLGVFKRRLKPKRAREEKESHNSRRNAYKSEAIVPVDVARVTPSQRQIHSLFEDKAQLFTYDDGLTIPKNSTPNSNLKRPPDDSLPYPLSQLPKRPPAEAVLTPPLTPTATFHPTPNICVEGGRIEFIKSPNEGANVASLNSPCDSADKKTRSESLSQYAAFPQTRCVGGVTRAQQTQEDLLDSGVTEEKCDFAKEFLEATIKELQALLECEREAVQKERLIVTQLQKQLTRRDAIQRDVDRERRLRTDIESRLRETVSESERYRETLAGLQREFSKMEDSVRTMLQYKTRCELLNQEKVFLTAIYESRLVQFQNIISKLEQENESLKQRLLFFEKIGTEEISTELLQRLRTLETENAHLFQDADFQRKQYERCLDDIANQVVRALLSQKGLREEIGHLQRKIKELENQNHALTNILVEKLDESSSFALPYINIDTTQEKNSSHVFSNLFPSEVCPQEQSGTSSSASFNCKPGERRHPRRLLLSDVEDKNILKSLNSIESLIVVPLQRPRSLNLQLHASPLPLSSAAVTSKQSQNRKSKLTLVTFSKKSSEDEGNESPESGNRDEGYSTMSSDVQGLGETNDLSKRELEDLKEASDETDVIADSSGEKTSTAVTEGVSNPEMYFIPLNFSLTINPRQSYPPSKKFLPFQHSMRSFSDSHLFLKLTTTAAASSSLSPSVLLVDVLDRTNFPKRSKPATNASVKIRSENYLDDSQSSTGSWCSGSWWDTEFFQHWLKLDDTRLKQQQQQRDVLQLQYDRMEIEEWSMSLSCEDVAMSADRDFPCKLNESPESVFSVKKSPEANPFHYSNFNLTLETKNEQDSRWFCEENNSRRSTWATMSPERSWGSASTNNSEEFCQTLNNCYFNETRSMDSPTVSEDPEESSTIDTDFTRDFYRLVKFESTKSLTSNSSKSNGHCDLGLLNQKQSEFAQEKEMALQSVLSFLVEQQKYCHHRAEEDIESQSYRMPSFINIYHSDSGKEDENTKNDYAGCNVNEEKRNGTEKQTQLHLSERDLDLGVNDGTAQKDLGNESSSEKNNKTSGANTCESNFLKETVNKKTNGSLKKGNHCLVEREIITKLPVRNSKNKNLLQSCTKDEKIQAIESFSRNLEPVKSRDFSTFVSQNKKHENGTLNQNSKHLQNSNQKEMSNSFTSSAQNLDAVVAVQSKNISLNTSCPVSPSREKWIPASASKKHTDAVYVKPTTENKIPRLKSDSRIRGTKIPVISCKKVESATAAKPKHLDVESSKPNSLKERDGDTNIPVLTWRCGKNSSRSNLKNPKTPESCSSAAVVVDDASFHEKATSKDVINELNKMIRKRGDVTPSSVNGDLKSLDMACCCPTGWVHVERDIDFTDPKARANLLDVMLASSDSSSGSGSSSDSGGDEPVDYTHLHRLHRFRRQRKASATRNQLGVLRYSLISTRPSIIGRENFFVRYGNKEKEAVASFDFLNDFFATSIIGCSSCDSLESNLNSCLKPTDSPIDQELPSPEIDVCTPVTPTTPTTPSEESEERTGGHISLSDSCVDSYPESVGSLEEQN